MFENILKKYNCEVFVSDVAVAEAAFNRQISASSIIRESGYSIRALSDKKMGSASSNIFEKSAIEKTAENSIDAGRHTKPLPSEFSFTDKKGKSAVSETFDRQTANDLESRAVELADLALNAAANKNILITEGRSRAVSFKYRIANSLGIEKEETGTFITVMIDAKAITEKQITEVPLLFKDRIYDKKGYASWLEKKADLVSRFVEPKKIPSGKYDILMSPQVFGPVLLDTAGFWATGKARLDGTGFFKKAGDIVADSGFCAAADGTAPRGLSTFSIDAEGNKTSRQNIVEKGAFTGYVYDEKYASYFNQPASGFAKRMSGHGAEKVFSGVPFCDAQNLIIESGKEKLESVLAGFKGIFIENVGLASADPETGAFGFELRNAFIADKGELVPARYGVFSGTVQDLLKKILLTKETEAVSETREFAGACVCPYALFEKKAVAGAVKTVKTVKSVKK